MREKEKNKFVNRAGCVTTIKKFKKYLKKHYKPATTVACVVIGSYWLGGFFMYLLCISIIAEMQISAVFWLLPCFIMALIAFVVTLIIQIESVEEK